MYVRFRAPEVDYFSGEEAPDSRGDLILQIEQADGWYRGEVAWTHEEAAEDLLVRFVESLVGAGQYPGDDLFDPTHIFADLGQLLQIAYKSATTGMFEPLTSVVEYCPPQWVITSTHLIGASRKGRFDYAIPIARINEPRWSQHMTEKTWIDEDSFDRAFSVAKLLFSAGKLAVKPPPAKGEPPF
ncbi:hypothetical protein Raf01_94680 [Rugosimonospora africana]|uniref:Uncharacterized protein n=1 Tax=Rugosimonospora africana TaxID=556532 RepID=A0A8J3VWX4_9ACTN|nr:hypothetical protein Raf01_94680 [Rugosimonospora africana]